MSIFMAIRRWFTSPVSVSTQNPWAGTPFDSVPEPSKLYFERLPIRHILVDPPTKPLYFVMHPDETYSVADPQPLLLPEDWTGERDRLARLHARADTTITQLRFLLNQAPMLIAPDDRLRAAHAITPYAYIHPKTFETLSGVSKNVPYFKFPPSPTKWVWTELVPEGRVIYTPNEMPGAGA